jgi:hypothetical protein
MSVTVVIDATFPIPIGFLCDGELVVCSGSVIAASLREWLRQASFSLL